MCALGHWASRGPLWIFVSHSITEKFRDKFHFWHGWIQGTSPSSGIGLSVLGLLPVTEPHSQIGFPHKGAKQLLGEPHFHVPACPREELIGFDYVPVPKTSPHSERDVYSNLPELGHVPIFAPKT